MHFKPDVQPKRDGCEPIAVKAIFKDISAYNYDDGITIFSFNLQTL